jgi:GNAT superfamily N-acetyltransferase
VHGTLTAVTDLAVKARALSALMERWQPEGRYEPMTADHPHYRGELQGTLVIRVDFARVDGKEKLLQNRKPEEVVRILEGLWERGAAGDPLAIEAIRAANPVAPTPAFLAGPEELRLAVAVSDGDVEQAERLLAGEARWQGLPAGALADAQRVSPAWVGAHDVGGRLVAMARAVPDGRTAWIHDLVVDAPFRGRGLGRRILALLLDHPDVRRARHVKVFAGDAPGFFHRQGFVDAAARGGPSAGELALVRR